MLQFISFSDAGAKKKQDAKQISSDLFGDASDISSDEEGKRKLKIHDSDSEAEKEDKPKKKKAKVTSFGCNVGMGPCAHGI